MPHIKSRDPLRASVPRPDLPGVEFGTDSLARIPVAWTRPQPTTSADTGLKLDPQIQQSGQVPYGSVGSAQYGATERPYGTGETPNPYTSGATPPNMVPSDDRLPLVIGHQSNPTFGGKATVSPGSQTSEATTQKPSAGPGTDNRFAPKYAKLGQSTTIVAGFGNQSPSGTGLRDQAEKPDVNPSYNQISQQSQRDPRLVFGKVAKSRFSRR